MAARREPYFAWARFGEIPFQRLPARIIEMAAAGGWLYGFTFNFSAAASLRWLVSKVRKSRAPKCNAVATWRTSRLRCPPAMVWRLDKVSASR